VPIFRGSTSRGTHVRAIAYALITMIEDLPELPTPRRVALRNHLAALLRAYPELENATELAQAVEEMDGIPQDDQV